MFNPIDMMQAQGAGTQAIAQQFGLTIEQTQRAFEALMPALTLGLQRGTGVDPTGFTRMFGVPDAARSSAAPGLDALGQMFGSAQLMQAVLQQASAASGVGSQVLRQMLPMMAGAVVASIVHVMLNQPQAEPARQPAAPPPVPFPFSPLWADMAKAFLPAAEPQPPRPPSRPQAAKSQRAAPTPEPAADPGPDVFQQMFRTGAEVQEQNLKAMQELFEAFWPAKSKTVQAESAQSKPVAPEPDGKSSAPAPRDPEPPQSTAAERTAPKPRRGRQSES